ASPATSPASLKIRLCRSAAVSRHHPKKRGGRPMARKPKVDEAALLAERMLQLLESQRSFGGDAYPPTLRHLGELCDGAPSDDLIVKAAGKKTFTVKAVVTQKVDKKPALDALVYFNEDL